MKIRRFSEDTYRQSYINGTLYQFIRYSDSASDFTEIIAQRWTGFKWIRVHHWASR